MGNARRALFVLAISALLAVNNAAFARVDTIGPDQPGVAAKTISVKTSTLSTQGGHSCNSSEWHFVINQIAGGASQAPASIFVTWSNGASATVPLSKFSGSSNGGVGHYTTTANLGFAVTGATATIYDAWSGQFVLSHGPCGTPTPTPPTPTPPTPTPPTPTPPTPTPPTPTPPTPTPPTPTPPTPTPPAGALVVSKYHDLDRDGVRDNGEPGLQGYVFVVHTIGTAFVTTLTTNVSGLATVSGLGAGMYVVTEIQQPGWFSTDPGGVIPTKTATVAAGQTSVVVFGNAQIILIPPTSAGRLVVTKYNDLNANGRRDAGEPALAGWSFTLRNNGATVGAATTGSDGTATFSDLGFGSYTVVEVTQPGWLSSDPGGSAPSKTVQIASATTSVAFGNFQPRLPNTASGSGQAPLDTLALLAAFLLAQAVIVGLAFRRRSARLSGNDLS